MQSEVGPVVLRRDGAVVDSETTLTAVGPHVVVVSTAIPPLGTQITTTYVGSDDLETVAVDLCLGVRPSAHSDVRWISRDLVPVTHDRAQCLLDHAREALNALRARHRGHWTVDVSDEAVDRAGTI